MAKCHSAQVTMSERSRVLVRGAGDVGSAVAVVLYRAGYAVALHDERTTSTPRRGMAFADAIFDGWATLDGLTAVRDDLAEPLAPHSFNGGIGCLAGDEVRPEADRDWRKAALP